MSTFRRFMRIAVFYISHTKIRAHKLCYLQQTSPKRKLFQLSAGAFILSLIKANIGQVGSKNKINAEKQISEFISQAEKLIVNGNLKEAKNILNNAIKIADDTEAFDNIAYLCDLLSSIVLSEGNFYEAESILVAFTERLLQTGFPETHNSIVMFKLKLARINHLLGSMEMAEFGFRDCIRIQEEKLKVQTNFDEESNGIYLTSLFWYGKLLADQQDFSRARQQYKFCWERILKSTNVLPSQKMVVLHSIANVSANMKDFDEALRYLYTAIEICLLEDPNNDDLPLFIVHVGLILFQKEIYESALFWCQAGHELAMHEGNDLAITEGQQCMNELRKLKIIP